MDAHGLDMAAPRLGAGPYEEKPFVDFSSGYFQRAAGLMPRQMMQAPWKQNQSYAHDLMDLRHGAIEDGVLELKRKPARAGTERLREAEIA
jgi:hypothetical protein